MPTCKLLPLFLLLVFAFATNGQSISVQGGLAIPTSNFANQSLKENNGFANLGNSISLQVSYPIRPKVGLTALASHSRFGLNTAAYTTELNKQIVVPGSSFQVRALSKYQCTNMVVGPYVQLGSERISVNLKMVFGFMYFNMAQLETQTNYAQTTNTKTSPVKSSISGTIGWGIACKANITNSVYLQVSADQFFANPQIQGDYVSNKTNTTTIQVQAFITALGVGYQF
jgi:hypothetical protein